MSDVAACPSGGFGLPLCDGGAGGLCPTATTTPAAFSSPDDPFDVYFLGWSSATGLPASGCGTTVAVSPADGLSVNLYVLPTPEAPRGDWGAPIALTEANGELSVTIDEGDVLFAGLSFEDLGFVVEVIETTGAPSCPTDDYDVTVQGY